LLRYNLKWIEIKRETTRKVKKYKSFLVNYSPNNHFLLFLVLENFSYWENKKQYLELMERCMNGKMDSMQFASEFYQMTRGDREKTCGLKEFLDTLNDVEFNKLINSNLSQV
jgi:hypothetical protein